MQPTKRFPNGAIGLVRLGSSVRDGVGAPFGNRPALRAANRNFLARLRRAAASSDSSLFFCERGAGAPLSHFPPGHAGSEQSSLPFVFARSRYRHRLSGVRRQVPIRRCLFVKGGMPPFHAFPPVMRAANEFAAGCFLFAPGSAFERLSRGPRVDHVSSATRGRRRDGLDRSRCFRPAVESAVPVPWQPVVKPT